jgi:hypothetical protein
LGLDRLAKQIAFFALGKAEISEIFKVSKERSARMKAND